MTSFVLRRLVQAALVLLGTSTVLFLFLRLSGDPVALMVGDQAATSPERITAIRQSLGLDEPLAIQYLKYVRGALTLDFGDSITSRSDAMQMVMRRVPATVELVLTSFVVAVVAGIPLGVFAALSKGTKRAGVILFVSVIGQSMPNFWFGIVAIMVFTVNLHWLPSFGGPLSPWHFVLPTVTLSVVLLALLVRLMRSEMLDVLGLDYVRTARAKGLAQPAVVTRHALRNALLPVITVLGYSLSALVGGSVIVEQLFSWPGIGQLMVGSVLGRDYPVVQAAVFLITINVVVVQLLVDLAYRVVDPRIKLA